MYGLPFDASVHGHEVDKLIAYVHVLMLVLFVGWGAFYVYILARFNNKTNPKADYHGAKTHASTYLELTVALIEVILLVGFSIPIYARVANQIPAEQDSVVVRAIAQQFNWNFQYPGADGKFGKIDSKLVDVAMNPMGIDKNDPSAQDDFFTITEMHVPTGTPVIVRVTSRDVIHSFGAPNFRVKLDAVPGVEVPTWFTAKIPGSYDIACSQLCGDLHYSMRGQITVDTPESYQTWLSSQTPAVMDIL
jgi:cytochrome c oxidase subunit 2